ncbi:MAG: hypothetical protein KC492_12715, partial [Myxococcales bacterium]|nr:hypothetical protein [Myxococcales bacterium]
MNTGVVNKAPFSDEGLQSTLALMNSDLQPEERRVLTNAFTRGAVRTRMLTILRDSPDLRQRVQADPTQAAAIGYALWSAGMLKVGPQTQDVFTSFADWTRGVMGFVAEHDQATQIMTAMKDGAIAARKAGKGEFELEQVIHTTAIQNAVKNMAKVSKAIMPHMSATFSSASARLRSFNNPYLTELVKQFYVAPGDVGSSQTYFEARTEFIGRWQNIAVRALDELTDAEKAEVEKALQGANVTPSTEAGKRGLANMRRLFRDMFKYAREAGVKLGDQGQVLKNGDVNYYPRVWDMQYLMRNHDTFKKMLLKPKYAKHLEGIGKQRGYYDKFGEFVETAEDLTPEQVVDAIYAALTHNDGYEHSGINYDRASHVPFAMSVNERLLNFLDEAEVEPFVVKNALQDVVLTYITQMVKRAEYTRRFGTTGERIDELLYNAEQNGATQAQIEAAHAFIKAMQGVYGANFDSKVSDFFAKLREKFTEEGTKPDNILKWLEETSG